MEDYRITKERILELQNCSTDRKLKEWFPEVFKKELEIGKWYKGIKHNFLVNYQGNGGINYGFWENSRFKNNIFFGEYWVNECREATKQEVETALIAEAKKRGFVHGAKFKSFENGNPIRTINENGYCGLASDSNVLVIGTSKTEWENYQSNPSILKEGKWAQIIPQEKQVISMRKALKIIAKKLKVSPEDIKIE